MSRPFSHDQARALVGACVADSFDSYRVAEYDQATGQFALLWPDGQTIEFVSAPRLLDGLAWGRWIISQRQLALAGMEDAR